MITSAVITNTKIANDAISTAKIQNGSIIEDKLATGSVSNLKIKVNTIGYDRIKNTTNKSRLLGTTTSTNVIDEVQIHNDMIITSTVGLDKIQTIPEYTVLANNNASTGAVFSTKIINEMVDYNTLALDKIQKIPPNVLLGRTSTSANDETIEEINCYAPARELLNSTTMNQIREKLSINNVDNIPYYNTVKVYIDNGLNTKASLSGADFIGQVTLKDVLLIKNSDGITKFDIDNATGDTNINGNLTLDGTFTAQTGDVNIINNTVIGGTLDVLNNDTTLKNLTVNTTINSTTLNCSTINANNINSNGVTTLLDNLILKSSGTDKFTVLLPSGNTNIAGTLGVGGLVTLSNDLNINSDKKLVTNLIQPHDTDTLNILGDVINIGTDTTVVNIKGVVNTVQSTNLEVSDATITLNNGGSSAAGAGFIFEDNSTNNSGSLLISSDKASLIFTSPGANTSAKTLATLTGVENLTNKTITLSSLNNSSIGLTTPSTGNFTELQLNGTAVTSDSNEINLLDGSIAGMVIPSKAVIYGSDGMISVSSNGIKLGDPTTNSLIIKSNSNLTTNKTLTINTGNGDRTLGINENVSFTTNAISAGTKTIRTTGTTDIT